MAKLSGRLAETGPKKNGVLSEKEQTENISLNQASSQEEVDSKNETLESELTKSYEKDLDLVLEKQEKLTDGLNKSSFSKNHSELITKGLESLKNLSEVGEGALKTLSAETVRFFKNNFLAVKLRSIYVEKKSSSLTKRLNKNAEAIANEEINNFLRTIKAGCWDSGSKNDKADRSANLFLGTLYNRKDNQFSREIANVWPSLASETGNSNNNWSDFLSAEAKKLEQSQVPEELIEIVDDDFIALKLAADFRGDKGTLSKSVMKRLDNIIAKYPNLNAMPSDLFGEIQLAAVNYPDLILSDSGRRQFLLSNWLYWNQAGCARESCLAAPFFIGDLAEYNRAETEKISSKLFRNWRRQSTTTNYQSIILHLPLNQKDLDQALKKDDQLQYWSLFELKRNSLKREKSQDNKNESTLLADLLEVAKRTDPEDSIIFLTYLIKNFPDDRQKIGETELADVLRELLSKQSRIFYLDELKVFQALFRNSHWPESLQTLVFDKNRVNVDILNKVVTTDSTDYDWIKNDPILFSAIERSFHKYGGENDRRHHFYDVLDGTAQTNDFDSLIKGYATSQKYCNSEELVTLFIRKNIDKKYAPLFIKDAYLPSVYESLTSNLKNGAINRDDYLFFLELAFEHGLPSAAPNIIEKLKADGFLEGKQLESFLEKLSDNVANYFNRGIFRDGSYKRQNHINEFLRENFVNCFGDKAGAYVRKTVESMINSESLGSVPIWLVDGRLDVIASAYPNIEEKKDITEKLLIRLLDCTSEDTLNLYFNNKEFWGVLDSDKRHQIEEKIFHDNINDQADYFFYRLPDMSAEQREIFERMFLSFYDPSLYPNSNLFSRLASESFFNFPDISAAMYKKILNDPRLDSGTAKQLFNFDIFRKFPDIEKIFIDNLPRWDTLDGVNLLNAYVSPEKSGESLLTAEQVKLVSETTLKNHGLSIEFWRGYTSSDKTKPAFYLDKGLYEIGLKNIGLGLTKNTPEEVITFLQELEVSEFGLNREQKVNIIVKYFTEMPFNDSRSTPVEVFYNHDAVLTEEAFLPLIQNNWVPLLNCHLSFSPSFNQRLLEAGLREVSEAGAYSLCRHFRDNNNVEILKKIKRHISSLPKKGDLWKIKKVLFDLDLMDVEESKSLYKEAISEKGDIRQQILQSIDIIGSMLSNDKNIGRLDAFFDKSSPERVKDLESIAAFMRHYPKENKGRTIVTMLFAREYLPERKLEEVVEKVALNLKKYEQILEQNSYRNIPEGIKASVGME